MIIRKVTPKCEYIVGHYYQWNYYLNLRINNIFRFLDGSITVEFRGLKGEIAIEYRVSYKDLKNRLEVTD